MAGSHSWVKRPIDVTLCGYYGFGNLGDELLAEGLVSLLERNGVARERVAVLTASDSAPEGVETFDRWRPDRVLSALRSSRTLLLGGGGLFQDSTSTRSCLYYWSVTRMARVSGCIPWAFGQSIGPLTNRFASALARDALRLCSVRCVRDRGSMDLISEWGLEAEIAPDPVISLSAFFDSSGPGGKYLLLNIRPWQGGLPEATARAASLTAEAMDVPILGVALSEDDVKVMKELREGGMFSPEDITLVRTLEDVHDVWRLGCCGVGMRLHFCVLSVLADIPCIAVPYDPKVAWFAGDWGLSIWNGEGPLPLLRRNGSSGERLPMAAKALEDSFARLLGTVMVGSGQRG